MRIVPLVAVAALVALGGVALAKGGSASGSPITIQGQAYFNSLSAAQQQLVLAKLYGWYQNTRQNGQWPPAVGDPQLANANDLTDPANFGITVDAFALTINYQDGAAGVLDVVLAGKLGAV